MSRVRYSFSIPGDAQIGPGGTLYGAIGSRVYDDEHRDVGHVSHVAQLPRELELEVSVYGHDARSVEQIEESAYEEGQIYGEQMGHEDAARDVRMRLSNWPAEEFREALKFPIAISDENYAELLKAIVARAEES